MKRTPAERVLARIDQSEGCWIWPGWIGQDGYGMVRVLSQAEQWRSATVHRVVYEALVGEIPEGMQLDHLCRVRHCCNPAHLEVVTPQENTRRGQTNHIKRLRLLTKLLAERAPGDNCDDLIREAREVQPRIFHRAKDCDCPACAEVEPPQDVLTAVPLSAEPVAEESEPSVSTYGQVAGAWGFPHVRGRCPSCGSKSLFLAVGGHVTCSMLRCADPCAADDLLTTATVSPPESVSPGEMLRLDPYCLDPEMVCADYPDVRVMDAERLEIALRKVMDEDEACDGVQVVLREGWRSVSPGAADVAEAGALAEVAEAARAVYVLKKPVQAYGAVWERLEAALKAVTFDDDGHVAALTTEPALKRANQDSDPAAQVREQPQEDE